MRQRWLLQLQALAGIHAQQVMQPVAKLPGLIRDCGGFDTNLYNSEDWDLWTRLVLAGRPADVQETIS